MTKLLNRFEKLGRTSQIIINILFLIFIFSLDYVTGNEISFSIFYLVPISLIAWARGKNLGIVFSVTGILFWIAADLLNEAIYTNYVMLFWNALVWLGFFLIVAFSLASLKRQMKLEEELTNFIVHDLKSPLANILASLMLLKEERIYEENETQKEIIDISIISGEKMKSLITSILDLGQLESKKMPIKTEKININTVIDNAINQIKTLANEKNIKISKFLNIEIVNTDEYLLLRIISNLLSNAIKVSPENSEIIIKTKDLENNGVEFYIEDQGIGIKDGMENKIFRKYSQLEVRKAGVVEGSGLGLTFCKNAVESQGGKIWIENKQAGGARVVFTLPYRKLFSKSVLLK